MVSRFGADLMAERARLAAEDPDDATTWATPITEAEQAMAGFRAEERHRWRYPDDSPAYLAAALGIDWNRSRGVIRCPAHDDHLPSLSYRWTETGGLLLHCFAGCTFDEIRNAAKGMR